MNRRLFSIRRRRNNHVDIWAPKVVGADLYRLKWNSAFGLAPITIIEATNVGFLDPNINQAVVNLDPLNNGIRMVFDPASFSIPDRQSFWVQFVPVSGGVEGVPGAMTLVLPAGLRSGSLVTFMGTPIGTQQIDFPTLSSVSLQNPAAMFVGFEEGAQLYNVPASSGPPYSLGTAQLSTLFVSGGAFQLSGVVAR